MFEPISIIVLGDPKAQKRHRHVSRGKFVQQYDPSAADKKDFLSLVQQKAPSTPFAFPIRVDMKFFFSRPKGHYYTGKREGIVKDNAPEWHTSKPDSDNLQKQVFDALNKVFWKDDSYICVVTCLKRYSTKPRSEITISPL